MVRHITAIELALLRHELDDLAAWLEFQPDDDFDAAEIDDLSVLSRFAYVRQILERLRGLNTCDWTTLGYRPIMMQCRRANIGLPAKIRGSISRLSGVTPCYVLPQEIDTIELELTDRNADSITTCAVADPGLIDRVQALFGGYQAFDFFGAVLPAKPKTEKGKPIYKFLLVDLRPSDNPLQMIHATPVEIDEAMATVEALSNVPEGLLDHVREQLIDTIGIRGLEDAPELDRSLSFMVLQALSDGYDPRRSLSHKLHSLVIGSPAVGKKLLCEAARILNPVYQEAHPGKVTVPGIAGKALKKDGTWISEPGLIPLAHRGTFAIQDFHHVQRKAPLMGVLSMAMEDGKIIDSTAANTEHHALTSIHLDMNKASDVTLSAADGEDTAQTRLADLGVTMNVITRFDYITDIPRDTQRQMEIALSMHAGTQRTGKYPSKRDLSPTARRLQVLVAYLRTAYAEISIPAALAEGYVRSKQEELLRLNAYHLAELELLGDYQTRLANSIHKLVFAIARGHARVVATEADVDEAFRYVHAKMSFLQTIEPFLVPPQWDKAPLQEKVVRRRELILQAFAEQEVSVDTVQELINREYDRQVSSRTIRRDLEAIAQPTQYGKFRIAASPNGKMAL